MTLPQMNIRYLYDPTGKSRDNLVVGEKHTIPPLHNRVIVPKLGAFYAKSLVVRNDSRIFELFKDYELTMLYHDATVETGQDVNVGIAFTNLDIVGDVSIQYQVVGGEFTGVWESVQQYVNTLLVDPRKVRWDDVLNKPELYAPMEHYHDINDVYGLNNLIPKLEEIRRAIMHIRSKEMRNVYDKIIQIRGQVEKSINDFNNGLVDRIKELMGENDSLEVVKKQIRNLNDNIQNLLDDNSVKDAIKTLNAKDIEHSNSITNLTDTKANKEYVDEKYQSNLDRINALNNVLPGIKNDINSKADKVEMATKLAELTNSKADKTTVDASLATMKKLLDSMEEEVSNVMSCSSIGRLPAKSWVNGSSVLARTPTGECYRLMTDDNFFQDLGVAFSADRTVKDEGQTFNVKCIVTNSGVSKNEVTTLVINPPNQNEKTAYSVTDFNASTQGAERFERINDFTYKIYGLGKGSTFTLEFKVVPAKYGTFQFGASVTVDGKWDTDNRNNNTSIILSSTTKIDPNYAASIDCPVIVCSDVKNPKVFYKPMITFDDRIAAGINEIVDRYNGIAESTLQGLRIKLDGASSVVVNGVIRGKNNKEGRPLTFPNELYIYKGNAPKYPFAPNLVIPNKVLGIFNVSMNASPTANSDIQYKFDPFTKILEILTDCETISVICRPAGSNCRWQTFCFSATNAHITKCFIEDDYSPVIENIENYSPSYYKVLSNKRSGVYIIRDVNDVFSKGGEYLYSITGTADYWGTQYLPNPTISYRSNVSIELPKGKLYKFNVYLQNKSDIIISGNINISKFTEDKSRPENKRWMSTVTVLPTATPTDSVTIIDGVLRINIID